MTSRKNITIFYFNGVNVAKHWDVSGRGRGGSRIFSQGGSGGTQCHKDAAGVTGEGTEGGLGGLPQENFEYEVL